MNVFISLFLLVLTFGLCSVHRTPTRSADPDEIGSTDDRSELLKYEFERTRNPATNSIPDDIRIRENAFVARIPSGPTDASNLFGLAASDSVLCPDVDQIQNHGVERTGGRTRALAIDVNNPRTLVIATAGGGVWRSSDDGGTWLSTSDQNAVQSATCVCQDPRPGRSHTWYYGTGEVYSTGGYPTYTWDMGVGIFKSTDSAKHWNSLPSTSSNRQASPDAAFNFVTALCVNPVRMDSDVVFAAANGCIMRSNNGGSSWSMVLGSPAMARTVFTEVAVSPTGVAYATIGVGGNVGIYRSVDGISWTKISTSVVVGSSTLRIRMAICPSNPNVVWFLKANPSTGQSILLKYTYLSGSGSSSGGTWEERGFGLSSVLETQGGYSMAVGVAADDENKVMVAGTSAYYSSDGFENEDLMLHVGGYSKEYLLNRKWDPVRPELYLYGNSHPDVHACVFAPVTGSTAVYLACDGGVFKTSKIDELPSTNWKSLNATIIAEQFYSIAIDPAGNRDGTFIGGAQDNNSNIGSRDGRAMRWVLGGDGMVCEMCANRRAVLPAYQGGQVFRVRMNDNLDAVLEYNNLRPSTGNFDFICPLQLDPAEDSVLYMVGGQSLWRNSNIFARDYFNDAKPNSTGWTSINLVSGTTSINNASALAVSTIPRNRVYVGSKTGTVLMIDNAHKTSRTISVRTGSKMPKNAYINNITVNPNNGNEVFVVFSNYEVLSVYHSTDAGLNWECIAGNLEEFDDGTGAGPACRWIQMLNYQSKTVYLLGTTSGVFWTTSLSGMQTAWYRFTAIPAVNVDMIKTRSTDGFIAVATHGRGIYTTYAVVKDAKSSGVGVQEQNPEFSLTVFPNPCSDVLSMKAALPHSGNVDYEVLSEQGRSLQRGSLDNANEDAVEHRIDVHNLATGRYWLLLRKNGRVVAKTSFIRSS